MSIKPMKWNGALAAAAIVALLGVTSSASALIITGGPTYTLPGGGSCSVAGDPSSGTATVTCSGVSTSSHTNVYFGVRNDLSALGNALDNNGPTGGETWAFSSNTATSITYTGATTVSNALGSSTQAVSTRMIITRTAGSGTVVSTGGTPANNGNSAIDRVFTMTSAGTHTFTVVVQASTSTVSGGAFGTTNSRYDAVNTPAGVKGDLARVDLGFYYSDCGDSVVDSPEACDEGAANGTAGSCCSSTCTFKTGGTTCRAAADACDVARDL